MEQNEIIIEHSCKYHLEFTCIKGEYPRITISVNPENEKEQAYYKWKKLFSEDSK